MPNVIKVKACKVKTKDTGIDFEILKLLYNEWETRSEQLWTIMMKMMTISFVLIFLPILHNYFQLNLNVALYLTTIFGILVATITAVYTFSEMYTLVKKKNLIRREICGYSPKYNSVYSKGNKFIHIFPIIIWLLQIGTAIIIILLYK